MKKRKAFTLVELLAVIIILAIIALIAIPIIINIIGVVRKESFKASLNGLFDAYDLYLFQLDEEDDPRISVVDDRLQLKSNFISGEITTDADGNYVVDLVTDGNFCAKGVEGNIKIVSGGCGKLDETPPEVTISISSVSSNSIKIAVDATDPEGSIKGYAYSLDGVEYTDLMTTNIYEFNNLTSNQTYNIYVQVTNEYDLVATKSIEIKTLEINVPTYSVNNSGWAKSKTVTINYPELANQDLTYEYSLNDGDTWLAAVQSQQLTFNENGSVIARVNDGNNTVTASAYFITNIDNEGPSIEVSANTTSVTSNPITLTVKSVDAGVGLDENAYKFNNSNYSSTNTYTTSKPESITIVVQDALGNTSTKTVTIDGATEYGYQDVASWSSSYSTTVPSGGYYKSKTQYQVNYQYTTWVTKTGTLGPASATLTSGGWNDPTTKTGTYNFSKPVKNVKWATYFYLKDCGENGNYYTLTARTSSGGTVTLYSSGDLGYYGSNKSDRFNKTGSYNGSEITSITFSVTCSLFSGRCEGNGKLTSWQEKTTTSGTTEWQDSSTSVPQGNKTGIKATRTVYAAPASWGSATGWRTDTPYTQTTSRKPLTRTSLQYVG